MKFGNRRSRLALMVAAVLSLSGLTGASAVAQEVEDQWTERCPAARMGRAVYCEVRETRVAAAGTYRVNARPNGNVTVRSWDRQEILVRAHVRAHAPNQRSAQEIASQVEVRAERGGASSSGPRVGRNEGWSVSFEVFAPRGTNLNLESVNGAIRVADITGDIEASTTNGGIAMRGVSGAVSGSSTNGGINIQLAGRSRPGAELDIRTTNGGIRLNVPDNFAADLEARTVNGSITSQIPLTVEGRLGRNVSAQMGGGGPKVRLRTTNGGISIGRV